MKFSSKTCVAPIERVKLLLQNQAASHHMAKSGHVPYTGNKNHKILSKLFWRYGKLLRSCCQRGRNNRSVERKHGHVWKTIIIFTIFEIQTFYCINIYWFWNVSKPISSGISQLRPFLFPARINIKAGLPIIPGHWDMPTHFHDSQSVNQNSNAAKL